MIYNEIVKGLGIEEDFERKKVSNVSISWGEEGGERHAKQHGERKVGRDVPNTNSDLIFRL